MKRELICRWTRMRRSRANLRVSVRFSQGPISVVCIINTFGSDLRQGQVTANPTAVWIARQLTEGCGWEAAADYTAHDRDGVYGEVIIRRLRAMGIRDRPTAPRSPWQNAYAERLIGSIRREVLDHVVVVGERHLQQMLLSYMTLHSG
jgi:hypothetical protein